MSIILSVNEDFQSSRPPAVHKKNIIAVNQKSFVSSLTELYYLIHDRIYNICYIQIIVCLKTEYKYNNFYSENTHTRHMYFLHLL